MRAAFGFLTVLGGARAPQPGALRWFPLVGAVVGGVVGSVWWLAGETFSPLLAAVLAIGADAAITGMLHLDGLADTADGLLPHANRERRLEIMRAPDVGAYGVVAIAVFLMLGAASLGSRSADIGLLAALWCTSRSVVAVVPAFVPYVREEGLASSFLSVAPSAWPALAIVPAGGGAAATIGWVGIGAVAATVLGALAVVGFARARLGGFTGDVLGAAIVAGQVAGLLVVAAQW